MRANGTLAYVIGSDKVSKHMLPFQDKSLPNFVYVIVTASLLLQQLIQLDGVLEPRKIRDKGSNETDSSFNAQLQVGEQFGLNSLCITMKKTRTASGLPFQLKDWSSVKERHCWLEPSEHEGPANASRVVFRNVTDGSELMDMLARVAKDELGLQTWPAVLKDFFSFRKLLIQVVHRMFKLTKEELDEKLAMDRHGRNVTAGWYDAGLNAAYKQSDSSKLDKVANNMAMTFDVQQEDELQQLGNKFKEVKYMLSNNQEQVIRKTLQWVAGNSSIIKLKNKK